jgi:tetratricopeptide (TPR) repeat protein
MATVATAKPALAHLTENATPPPITLNINSGSVAEPPSTQTTTAAEPATPPRPTPVIGRTTAPEPANRVEELVQLGKQLRDRGDMSSAITKFREAATIDAKNPIPLNELATTYDKMGLADKAAENWRKIYEMGDSAGIYYQVAEGKIKIAQQKELRNVEHAPPAPDVAVDNSGAIDGIAAGATLGLLKVTSEEQHDEGSAKHFTLHIPIKARPKSHIEVRDLVLHILFYDIVDGQNVVQTSANVNFRWATPPADWVDSDTEELTVEYQLPKAEAKAAKRENRKYFGYIVRIYYKQQLQGATAEPERLAQQYPAPPTLPKESDKQ